jgi:SAM-dependent methyltransferase
MNSTELRMHAGHALTSNTRGQQMVEELIHARLEAEPELKPSWDTMTDEQARFHEGPEHAVEHAHLRAALRLFHAWRVHMLRERLGDRLESARILDVGDVDGLILRALGKDELGFNLAATAVANIEANGVRAVQGDGHRLPFDDGSFDAVLCFETLEHVESPPVLLDELARVCRRGGAVFVSIPWVPRTFVHGRDPSLPRGHQHVFEFSRDDFAALVSHTPLEIAWDDRFELLGPPARPSHRAVLAIAQLSHIVAGTFHRFQFFELRHR